MSLLILGCILNGRGPRRACSRKLEKVILLTLLTFKTSEQDRERGRSDQPDPISTSADQCPPPSATSSAVSAASHHQSSAGRSESSKSLIAMTCLLFKDSKVTSLETPLKTRESRPPGASEQSSTLEAGISSSSVPSSWPSGWSESSLWPSSSSPRPLLAGTLGLGSSIPWISIRNSIIFSLARLNTRLCVRLAPSSVIARIAEHALMSFVTNLLTLVRNTLEFSSRAAIMGSTDTCIWGGVFYDKIEIGQYALWYHRQQRTTTPNWSTMDRLVRPANSFLPHPHTPYITAQTSTSTSQLPLLLVYFPYTYFYQSYQTFNDIIKERKSETTLFVFIIFISLLVYCMM